MSAILAAPLHLVHTAEQVVPTVRVADEPHRLRWL